MLELMAGLRSDDRDWRGGRVFSLVYSAGPEVHDLLERAATLYSAENALNTAVFPSLGRMQQDIIVDQHRAARRRTGYPAAGRDPRSAAILTSGGTESLLQATRRRPGTGDGTDVGVDRPNMVLATTAHAAFEKAAHYFDVESRRWFAVRSGLFGRRGRHGRRDGRPDTVMVVGLGGRPTPRAMIDPVAELAAHGRSTAGILCHVDACLGGFLLPFLHRLGHT